VSATILARVDRGRAALRARGLSYPGGDSCSSAEVRGLASLLTRVDDLDDYTDDERAALRWLRMWVDAGAATVNP